jgi:hypothetical protein
MAPVNKPRFAKPSAEGKRLIDRVIAMLFTPAGRLRGFCSGKIPSRQTFHFARLAHYAPPLAKMIPFHRAFFC